MGTIFRTRGTVLIALLIIGAIPALGQTFREAQWSRIKMDSTYDGTPGKAAKVIDRHKATSPALHKPVGKCGKKLKSQQLSHFVTNAMLDYAKQRLTRATKNPQAKADLAIVHFKDKKACIPAGDVTPLDIISLFPMDNRIIILELEGKYMRELIRHSERTGGVTSLMEEPIEEGRIYKIITLDFLLRDKKCAEILEHALNLQDTYMYLGNTLIQHVKRTAQKGETI